MLEFEVPWPPSVNHYYRHVGPRVLISREGRRYRDNLVALLSEKKIEKFTDPVSLHIELYPPDSRRRDVDNSLKCLLDSFTHGGLYEDDSQIYHLSIEKNEPLPPDGMAYIRIQKWKKEDKTPDFNAKSCRTF